MPSRVSDRVSYRQAMHLARTVEELGGRVRLDVCDANKGGGSGRTAANATPTGGASPRPSAAPGRTCPKCGNVEPEGATFCSICLERFSRSRIDARLLRERGVVEDNPLAERAPTRPVAMEYVDSLKALPAAVKAIALIFFVGIVLQLLLR
jgi:hypothetical protein